MPRTGISSGAIRSVIAKFHYTDTDTGPTRTKSAHVVGYELNSTTRARHGPDTDTDTDFFAAKLRWVRAGPFGSVSVVRVRVVEFSYNRVWATFINRSVVLDGAGRAAMAWHNQHGAVYTVVVGGRSHRLLTPVAASFASQPTAYSSLQ